MEGSNTFSDGLYVKECVTCPNKCVQTNVLVTELLMEVLIERKVGGKDWMEMQGLSQNSLKKNT